MQPLKTARNFLNSSTTDGTKLSFYNNKALVSQGTQGRKRKLESEEDEKKDGGSTPTTNTDGGIVNSNALVGVGKSGDGAGLLGGESGMDLYLCLHI